jgi:midasin (ATPase involved in ribosome maturation)
LGVNLGKGAGGSEVPARERFKDIERTLTNEDLRQMQKIAIALKLCQPIMLEEYSGSGKTTKIEHMCSLLNTEIHYANCHDFDADVLIGKMTTDEDTKSGFGWQDGLVMDSIRNGGVLFLDEYNFMRGDVRARMHEILDALLRGKETISLIENNHEIVEVNPNLRIVAAQNPPGGEFGDREVLDPAQYTRFVQIKGPSEMPKETKLARALGFVNRDNKITISQDEYLTSEAKLTPEQLAEIPGIEEILRLYVEFEDSFEKMVKNHQIGRDQPQPIYTAFQRDYDRIMQFVQMFYNGDLSQTFQQALKYYYSNRLESDEEQAMVEEKINHVVYVPPVESTRRTLAEQEQTVEPEKADLRAKVDEEIAGIMDSADIPDTVKEALRTAPSAELSPDILKQLEQAKDIFGSDFIGPVEIKAAFGTAVETEDVPTIPFSMVELKQAEELGQMLILRQPLTMQQIGEALGDKVKDEGKVFYDTDWYKEEKFFTEELAQAGWALVSKEVVPDSTDKNFLDQTDLMVDYLKNQVFKGVELPAVYQEAIDEYLAKRTDIATTMSSDWQKAAGMLESLQITELTRQSPSEALYDLVAYFQNNDERMLPDKYSWTKRRYSDGRLVYVGHFGSGGVHVSWRRPGRSASLLGVSFSRSQ